VKVSFDLKNDRVQKQKAVTFSGFQPVKSEEGFRELEFAYPYDQNTQECYLKVYKTGIDSKGNYYIKEPAFTKDGHDGIKLSPDGTKIDFQKTYGFSENQPFAYNYHVFRKDNTSSAYRVDAGDIISQDNKYYNIVSSTKSGLTKGGAMKLVIVDSQNVGYVYNDRNVIVKDKELAKRGEESVKTLTNKYGGTLAGMELGLDSGEYDNYSRIISPPIFTDDDFSAHGYWNKNCKQIAKSFGNINNYASFMQKMFAHGLNFVADGAFVNEGLEGTHFASLLKWGENSPYFYWFRAGGLNSGTISLGIFSKDKKHISHKIVNSPYYYSQKDSGRISISRNRNYDKTKPTYIQFYDDRFVTDSEKKDNTSLIKSYSILNTPNVYDLHDHNDSIFPYYFEIKPEVYNKNIINLNDYNSRHKNDKIRLDSPEAARLLSKSEYYTADGKFESGFETWDANVDIAKLNFVFSNSDVRDLKNMSMEQRRKVMEKMVRANYQVWDYTVDSGAYWTQLTDDVLRLYIAQNLKNVDPENPSQVYGKIMALSNNKVFPQELKTEVSKNEVTNVVEDMYNHKRELSDLSKKEMILEGAMNTPLDAVEFGQNITTVLASPLISKRANVKSEIGMSRYDVFKKGNINLPKEYEQTYKRTDEILEKELAPYVEQVLNNIDSSLPERQKLFDGEEVTEYGKYVLPILLDRITKYAMVNAFVPDIPVTIDSATGALMYDYKVLNNVYIQKYGVTNFSNPKDEANAVLDIMQKGIKKLDTGYDSAIVESCLKSLKDTSVESFKLADLIIDKTQAGLDWRIDATKDMTDVEALRNGNETFGTVWDTVIDFWKTFVHAVQEKNPNAYTVAEVTDVDNLHDRAYGNDSRFPANGDIIPKFLRETGMTALAEYSYFFGTIQRAFANEFENGAQNDDTRDASKNIYEKMVIGSKPFIRSGAQDALKFAYTFIGNHDKPRALHCAALDMSLFYSDVTYDDAYDKRERAYRVLEDKHIGKVTAEELLKFKDKTNNYALVSPKAIAMAEVVRPALINQLNTYKEQMSQDDFDRNFKAISKATADLAGGKFKGHYFDPEAFGIKPIDVAISMVLQQAKSEYGFAVKNADDKDFEDKAFELAMKPAMSKLLAMMKYLVALPGMPTLYDGDDRLATGYDTKTKNMYLQGRQKVHEEWTDVDNPRYKSFIADYKTKMDDIMKIRRNPKCNALNNGAIFTLPLNKTQQGLDVASILRQSSDGRMAISIFNPEGIPKANNVEYGTNKKNIVYIDRLYMDAQNESVGISGVREGTKFVNAEDEKDLYYTRVDNNGKYYLTRHYDGKDVPIKLDSAALILYHLPEKNIPLTFTGSCMVKPNSRYVTNAYENKTNETGKKLTLLSR